MRTGESFTADCNFSWSMWLKGTDGIFVWGSGAINPGDYALGILFSYKNGVPSPIASGVKIASTLGYFNHVTTGVDGSFIIRYSWPWSWLRQEKIIHVIASHGADGLRWRVAPESEPVIPDADGFKVIAKGDKDFGFTLKRIN